MPDKVKIPRLGKAAIEFNVSTSNIVDFLFKKGFEIEDNGNTKLTQEMYSLIVAEYQKEKDIKERSSEIEIGFRKGTGAEQETVPEEPLKKKIVERPDPVFMPGEVFIKDVQLHPEQAEHLDLKVPKVTKPKVVDKIDLESLENEINEINEGKTAYHNLHVCERRRKAEIKQSSPDTYKVYEAVVKCDGAFDESKLDELLKLNEIHQQTPLRVLRRRADKVRVKHVLDLSCDVIDEETFKMRIKTEGGLYIKELISGDDGRSNPNVSEILGVNAICEQLDVIEVSEK